MENKFTEEEFLKLKGMISEITTHLPEHYVGQIWSAYVKITAQPQPNRVPVRVVVGYGLVL